MKQLLLRANTLIYSLQAVFMIVCWFGNALNLGYQLQDMALLQLDQI